MNRVLGNEYPRGRVQLRISVDTNFRGTTFEREHTHGRCRKTDTVFSHIILSNTFVIKTVIVGSYKLDYDHVTVHVNVHARTDFNTLRVVAFHSQTLYGLRTRDNSRRASSGRVCTRRVPPRAFLRVRTARQYRNVHIHVRNTRDDTNRWRRRNGHWQTRINLHISERTRWRNGSWRRRRPVIYTRDYVAKLCTLCLPALHYQYIPPLPSPNNVVSTCPRFVLRAQYFVLCRARTSSGRYDVRRSNVTENENRNNARSVDDVTRRKLRIRFQPRDCVEKSM